MRSPHKSMFIDCTLAGGAEQVSGISRVVRELITATGVADRAEAAVCPQPVAVSTGRFRPCSIQQAPPARKGVARSLRTMARRADEWLRDHAPSLEHAIVKAVMAAGGIPSLGLATAGAAADGPPVHFHPGDVLVLADATWMVPRWQQAVASAKAEGAKIVPVIYDLLPISHPQFFAPLFCAQFERWLTTMIPMADAFVCISHATADALREFATHRGLATAIGPVGVFPLGAKLTPGEAAPSTTLATAFRDGARPFLMVGTIEPRKNHLLVLDAFDQVWSEDSQAPLVVIGKRGWQCEDVIARFADLTRNGRPFTYICDATDADLQYAYRRSRCLIFPSFAEGFGLPIVEALAQGLPVIASDIPVHREVGNDHAMYIPLGDPDHLARLLLSIENGSTVLTAPEPGTVHLPTWADSVAQIQQEITTLLATV
jgi:glycosyltransferase involved in cell wall biosynthesis